MSFHCSALAANHVQERNVGVRNKSNRVSLERTCKSLCLSLHWHALSPRLGLTKPWLTGRIQHSPKSLPKHHILIWGSIAAFFTQSGHTDTSGSHIYGDVLVQSQLGCQATDATDQSVPISRLGAPEWYALLGIERRFSLHSSLQFGLPRPNIWPV